MLAGLGAEAQWRRFQRYTRIAEVFAALFAVMFLVGGALIAATSQAVLVVVIEAVRRWTLRPGDLSREQRGTHLWVAAAVINFVVTASVSGGGEAATIPYLATVPMVLTYLTSVRAGAVWLIACTALFGLVHSLPLWADPRQELAPGPVARFVTQVAIGVMLYGLARSQVETVHAQAKELESARDAALAAERAKTEFVARVSHELRTPLGAAAAAIENLAAAFAPLATGADGQATDHRVRTALTAVDRARQVVDDILTFSRLDAGAVKPEIAPFRLRDIIEEVADVLRPTADRKHLRLICTVDPNVPRTVDGDGFNLRRMLLELLGNAVKYTDSGQVGITATWHEGTARIEVWDTGIGIAPDLQTRIFDRFEQGDGSPTRRFAGVGLGLAITRHIADLLDCTIEVDSAEGAGSRFILQLPLSRSTSARVPAHHQLEVEPGSPPDVSVDTPPDRHRSVEGPCVLIVDDDDLTGDVLADTLEILGCNSILAKDGPAALDILQRQDGLAAMLLDLHLPGMHGAEVARRARALRGHTLPILVLTADITADQADLAANLVLTKPAGLSDLRAALRALGVMSAPFDVSQIAAVLDKIAAGVNAADLPTIHQDLDELHDRACEFTERLLAEGESARELHFLAHRNLVGSLTVARQFLSLPNGSNAGEAHAIARACLTRATRWEDNY